MEEQNIDESLNKIAKEISVIFGDITYIATQKCVCGGGTIKEGSTREVEITEKLVLPSEIKQIINDYIQQKISALKNKIKQKENNVWEFFLTKILAKQKADYVAMKMKEIEVINQNQLKEKDKDNGKAI